jgi:hypothetical protein
VLPALLGANVEREDPPHNLEPDVASELLDGNRDPPIEPDLFQTRVCGADGRHRRVGPGVSPGDGDPTVATPGADQQNRGLSHVPAQGAVRSHLGLEPARPVVGEQHHRQRRQDDGQETPGIYEHPAAASCDFRHLHARLIRRAVPAVDRSTRAVSNAQKSLIPHII